MKKMRRIIALALFVCLVISLLPQQQIVRAADVMQRYELDTDGIDVGAQYLLVSGTGSTEYALQLNTGNIWASAATAVSVVNGSAIAPFNGENNCLWSFSSSTNGTVYCSGYYLNINQYTRYQSHTATMQFASFGDGRYGIYTAGGASTNLQYLRYGQQNALGSYTWHTAYTWGKTGTDSSAYQSFVYLYKRVENQGVSVSFDANGATAGTVPKGEDGIKKGSTYTLPKPSADLRKDVGHDTWLFRCWNTKPDGTGTEYDPEEQVTVTENITFYAEWYLQTKYAVNVITDLDGAHTDMEDIEDGDVTLYVKLDAEGSELIPLERTAVGTYTAYVTQNGTYLVYAQHGSGEPFPAHGHKVVIFNQSGSTELLNYSVSYDANGGSWEGETPATANYHANTPVTATELVPTREGYRFLGWQDQNGKQIAAGGVVTEALLEKTTLTAVWEALISFTVTVVMEHGDNTEEDRHQVTLQLMQEKEGVNLPCGEAVTLSSGYSYNGETNTTTYTYTFENLPDGHYHVITAKSHYLVERIHGEDHTATLNMTFTPDTFDLNFRVKVNGEKALLPAAVNVKIAWWNGSAWQIISRQAGEKVPYSVQIDENGEGNAFYSVLKNDPDTGLPRHYRLVITSFVMPDGKVVAATGDGDTYTLAASGLYTATVSVENGSGSDGAYFKDVQIGTPLVTVAVNPYTVTFDAGDGTLNGEKTVVLDNQYAYPDLTRYVPQSSDAHHRFAGWYVNGVRAENLAGTYLTGDVTYEARFSLHAEVTGDVFVAGTYQQDGETIPVKDIDRVYSVLVVLEKNINGVYNDVDSQSVEITYIKDEKGDYGHGIYHFEHLPNDGTQYAIRVVVPNFGAVYNNNGDTEGSEQERNAILDEESRGVVDVYMILAPELYTQWAEVDTTRIAESFRPTDVEVSYLHRDMEGHRPFAVIAQHVDGGVTLPVDENGVANGFYSVWKGNITGAVCEYQLRVEEITVDGEKIAYDENAPFTVDYGISSWFSEEKGAEWAKLTATLIPREYEIIFDLNCNGEPVQGMENYLLDSSASYDQYGFVHTWSEAAAFSAFPYREGYVFAGWTIENEGVTVKNHGDIYVAPAVAESLTLTANWTMLSGTDYTVRFLELNTDKVLKGALTVSGAAYGSQVFAQDVALEQEVPGYVYAGAMIRGTFFDKTQKAPLLVIDDPTRNLITLYYIPEGSHAEGQDNVTLEKDAVLEKDGSYTIQLDLHAENPPVITILEKNTPLDIVLVLDQSGSIVQNGYLDELQQAVNNFVNLIADHGRSHQVDHRIAVVGYAGNEDEPPTGTDTSRYPIAGGTTSEWVNTGVFDSNGDFHPYPVQGFNYSTYFGQMKPDGIYYTYSNGEYLLLTYHAEYRHLITEQEAKLAVLNGETVYGYVFDEAGQGSFTELTRNTSGLWLYGDKQLYSETKFFTYHQDVWTHRAGLDRRQIHGYGTGNSYRSVDGHEGVYTRAETRNSNTQLSIYKDALVPVSVGAGGSGGVNPGLAKSVSHLASNGGTYVQYGIEMANRVFEANPLDKDEGRVRVMILFTDGMPGIGVFDETVANAAIEKAYTSKNTYNAHTYAIGLYPSESVSQSSDQAYFMNAISSNYPKAKKLDDVRIETHYEQVADGVTLNVGGPYYVLYNGNYYELKWTVRWVQTGFWTGEYQYHWSFEANGRTVDITNQQNAAVVGGGVGGYAIYRKVGDAYKPTDYSGYYATTDSEQNLKDYFELVMHEITTRITTKVRLREDTMLRDILGGGLVLESGATITAYKIRGTYDEATDAITWEDAGELVAQVEIPENRTDPLCSPQTTTIRYEDADGVEVIRENVPYITVRNLNAENPDDPDAPNYRPHSVDVTGYDFEQWYEGAQESDRYKLQVVIRGAEATDSVEFGRATYTNGPDSGLWSPEDEEGNRELLVPFERPTTIFVQRAYVLDYGKEFELTNWYFDDEDGNDATPVHLDLDIANGMNGFDTPNLKNETDGAYGNTAYGNVRLDDKTGKVYYSPTTMSWGGYDSFYVFGETWRKTVKAQDANENGNLWNKVTVIPANNIYYEDSFITKPAENQGNAIEGFVFSGEWQTVYDNGVENAGQNVEHPEHLEGAPYGDVHGWTDSLGDDKKYTDGSAHAAGLLGMENRLGATAQFTFTGTGVDVYSRTNSDSGVVIAMLYQQVTNDDGETELEMIQGIVQDNLAVSGDYYHIPTISFDVPYGTYTVELIATMSSEEATGDFRYEYYLDGVRVYNPLGNTTNYKSDIIKDAYGLENNAVFKEVRDILLDYGDFNTGLTDGDDGKMGAVFIDWIREGQGTNNDKPGESEVTYEIGTFESYGPKNEVYLTAGQAIVMKVDEDNTYYVGMKSLTGNAVEVNVSGIDLRRTPTTIEISHSTDMYYRVNPVDGYIVIQNGNTSGEEVLAITNLRTTNGKEPAHNAGVLPVKSRMAVMTMRRFAAQLQENETFVEDPVEEEVMPPEQPQVDTMPNIADALFVSVRQWLKKD